MRPCEKPEEYCPKQRDAADPISTTDVISKGHPFLRCLLTPRRTSRERCPSYSIPSRPLPGVAERAAERLRGNSKDLSGSVSHPPARKNMQFYGLRHVRQAFSLKVLRGKIEGAVVSIVCYRVTGGE